MAVSFGGGGGGVPVFTFANKPTSYPTGWPVFLSNVGTKGSFWHFDGTRWKPVNDQCILATLDSPQTMNGGASETLLLRTQLPAGGWTVGDRVRVSITATKSGTTASNFATANIRIGTAGTVGGDSVAIPGLVIGSAAQHAGASIFEVRLDSATSVQQLGNNQQGYGSGTTNAVPTPLTIPNVSTATWIGVYGAVQATDAVIFVDAQIEYRSSAN